MGSTFNMSEELVKYTVIACPNNHIEAVREVGLFQYVCDQCGATWETVVKTSFPGDAGQGLHDANNNSGLKTDCPRIE